MSKISENEIVANVRRELRSYQKIYMEKAEGVKIAKQWKWEELRRAIYVLYTVLRKDWDPGKDVYLGYDVCKKYHD
jgi:hypothetical protein